MCDRMRMDRRLTLIGVMLVVLSMTMATQYATTKVSYSFAIVHPSNADIRFIGSDNSSDDGLRCLRVSDNSTGTRFVTLELGDWMPNSNKNYTAALGIVNEEGFYVNLTHVNISGVNASYLDVWLHGDRDADLIDGDQADSVVKVIEDGTALYTASDVVWTFTPGDGTVTTMCADTYTEPGCTQLTTLWDDTSHIQYSTNDANNSVNKSSDFVWVGVSLNLPDNAGAGTPTGLIEFHFKASTTD